MHNVALGGVDLRRKNKLRASGPSDLLDRDPV